MPYASADDGIRLHYEEAGSGTPIIFVHEFGGSYRSFEMQMRHFSRHHRCITFAARGYPPSDVPESVEMYSQTHAMQDIVAVMDAANVTRAHAVGVSMGGFAVLQFGLERPERALSIAIGGVGYGAEKQFEEYFRAVSLEVARQFEQQGSKEFAKTYSLGASRVQFQNKDPRGWREFADMLGEHSAVGAANTMRGVQAKRPSIYDWEDRLRAMTVPTLVIVGDEDDHCLQPGLFLKRAIQTCGLLVLPKTGHAMNLEEPEHFNRFLGEFITMVEAGKWAPRDPRATPAQIMKTN
ncbi:MAG: alpha/beta hydrolase [Pseudomonadota bacterium]|nr:alpha/beta hydrolase [Pseudomonadota bacterium]